MKFQIIIKSPEGIVNLVRATQEEFDHAELTNFCKKICKKLKVNYRNSEISISNYPEKNRSYWKSPGFITLGAHG